MQYMCVELFSQPYSRIVSGVTVLVVVRWRFESCILGLFVAELLTSSSDVGAPLLLVLTVPFVVAATRLLTRATRALDAIVYMCVIV